MNHLILGLSFAETRPGLSCNSQDFSYHGQGLWLRGLTQEKKHSVTTTTQHKKARTGWCWADCFFCVLVFFSFGPRWRTITCQIRSLATLEICIIESHFSVGMDSGFLESSGEIKRTMLYNRFILNMRGSLTACVVALLLESIDVEQVC